MYWFAGINDNSKTYKEMYITSLKTAKKITRLRPILLYDGTDSDFVSLVEGLGGKVVHHRISFYEKPNFITKSSGWKGIATGTFLRIDIPILCGELGILDEFVLYTDTDVLFVQDVVADLQKYTPAYFAVCPEFNKTDYINFNAGIMLINIKGMLDTHKEFTDFMETHSYEFPSFDQGALQAFYKNKQDKLPIFYNFKPCWGISSSSKIIHYHGPKHWNILDYINGVTNHHTTAYKDIFTMVHKDVWMYYMYLYESYEKETEWAYYLNKYPELIEQERKKAFDWKAYLFRNPDLQKHGVTTEEEALNHWDICGKLEGRNATPLKANIKYINLY